MRHIIISRGGARLLHSVAVADTFLTRLRGLLFRPMPAAGEGLLLTRCGQIHTFGMRYAIDALFLSKDGDVLHIERRLAPGRAGPFVAGCRQVLELSAGEAERCGIREGDRLQAE